MRFPLTIATLVLSTVFWSCGQRLTGPKADGFVIQVRTSLSSPTGSPEQPIDVTATATNRGPRTIYHPESCWLGAVRFEVLDPEGQSVSWYDPRMAPLCPDACCVPLEPGESAGATLRFSGQLFTEEGAPYQAPAGTYTVMARFDAHTEPQGGNPISATRRLTFHWRGAT